MKIALCIDANNLGGIETHLLLLSSSLTELGYNCQIFFLNDLNDNPLFKLCESRRINYHKSSHLFDFIRQVSLFNPQFVHSHGYKANILCRLLSLIRLKRSVATYHAGEKVKGKMWLYTAIDRYSSFLSRNIAVNSQIAKTLLFNSTVIPNFIRLPKDNREYVCRRPFKLFFVGRVSAEKGPEQFCQLNDFLSIDYEYHMVGDGPLLKDLRKKYTHLVYHGQITNMDAIWPECDMLCITSKFEGLPLVLLEALCRKIPVVSFDVGAIKKIIPEMTITAQAAYAMANKIKEWFQLSDTKQNEYLDEKYSLIKSEYSTEVLIPRIIHFYEG